ncbi:MAG: peptidylprolyl isomerase [Terriglobales bacterium]
MLNFFRRRDFVARLVLGGFLVVICIAMVMFLIPQGMSGDSSLPVGEQTVAKVNGAPITGQMITDQLTRIEGNQQLPAQLVPMLGQEVLKSLVVNQALLDQARQLGLTPTPAEIVASAQEQLPQLYPNGQYIGDQQAEDFANQALHMTLAQLQDQLRQGLMISKVQDLVTDPVRVSAQEIQQQFERDNEKATVDYVLLKPADMESQVKVTPQALAAYYKVHQASYNSPEKRQLEVLLANETAIGAQIHISDAAVQQYYQQNISTYSHPEQVKVSHILIKYPDASPTAAEIASTKQKADDVLKQVQAKPTDFAALAKKYSQDDASAAQGGELGFIQRNQTVANFEKVAFSLPAGHTSGLVQTEYGFEIINVEAHQQAYVQPESAAHDQIVAQLQRDQAVDKAQNLMNQAAEQAQTAPLAQVAKQLGLEYFTTAPLSRTDPVTGIGINPDFENAVFSTTSGAITQPVQVAQGFAIAKVDKVVPPGPQPLSAVQDAVTTAFKQEQAQQLAQSTAAALQAAAQKQGLKAAAGALHLTMKSSAALTRSGSLPDAGAISSFADTLFALKPGAVAPVASLGDNRLVYSLTKLDQPSAADFAAQQASITQTLVSQKRQAVMAAYDDALIARLTKAGKITINQDALQRVLGGAGPAPSSPGAPPPPRPLGLG